MPRPSTLQFLSLFALLSLALPLFITVDGLTEEDCAADVAVVLGNQVHPDGTPSDRLKARLDRAAELYELGCFASIILSGGIGKEGVDEAVAMRDYLLRYGIAEDALIVDSEGANTEATANFVARWMADNDAESVLAISQFFHLTRTRHALERAGVPTVKTSYARYFELRDIYSLARESVALPWYWLK